MSKILAYHFLRDDMTARSGKEKAWEIGEERSFPENMAIELCTFGYHSAPTLWDALQYAPGPMACLVEISEPIEKDDTKQVSRTRKLIKAVNIDRELRLFAADCAERVLYIFEKHYPKDDRPRKAIQAARDFADGKIDAAAWAAARAAAWDAARAAAWDAARAAAWDAAGAAAGAAAWDAAWDAARAAAWDAARAAARAAEIEGAEEHA
jgi:hypothetical protein